MRIFFGSPGIAGKLRAVAVALILVLATLLPCPASEPLPPERPGRPLGEQRFTWAVVYAPVPVASLAANMAGLLLIDPDAYTASDVAVLQPGRRLVFSYLSVGEFESYRSYGNRPEVRALVIDENPQWPENFRVRYWEPQWLETLGDYLETILAKGFDGLVFDVVDAWETFPADDRPARRAQMTDLIIGLVTRARRCRPQTAVLLLNSHPLFADERVLRLCDGMIQEGLHATWLEPSSHDNAWRQEKTRALQPLRRQGKFVGLLEYTRDPLQMRSIKKQALADGFAVYFSEKNLDRLFPIP